MEHLRFLTAAMRDRNVGAVVPTFISCVRTICKQIDKTRPVVVVEFGPGTGVFTRHLLRKLHPDSTIVAIELNRMFVARLSRYAKKQKPNCPRLEIVCDDANNIKEILGRLNLDQADYVISGIPFSLIKDEQKSSIVERTRSALVPGGKFIVYQYSFAMRKRLKSSFEHVRLGRIFFNLPPMCVMVATKAKESLSPAPRESVSLSAEAES